MMKIILSKINNIIMWIILSVILLVVALVCVPSFFNLTPYVVNSELISSAYDTGSMVFVKSVEASEIEVGDAISYVYDEDLTVVTNIVIEIDDENSIFTIIENGDEVHFNNLVGVALYSIPFLGLIYSYFSTSPGVYIFALVLIWIIIGSVVAEYVKYRTSKLKH